MMPLTFTIPGPPVPKARPRFAVHKGRPMAFTPARTKGYEALVKREFEAAAHQAGGFFIPLDHAVRLDLQIYLPDNTRKDCDNIEKGIRDALNGLAWADDYQVRVKHIEVCFDMALPRVEVALRDLGVAEVARVPWVERNGVLHAFGRFTATSVKGRRYLVTDSDPRLTRDWVNSGGQAWCSTTTSQLDQVVSTRLRNLRELDTPKKRKSK